MLRYYKHFILKKPVRTPSYQNISDLFTQKMDTHSVSILTNNVIIGVSRLICNIFQCYENNIELFNSNALETVSNKLSVLICRFHESFALEIEVKTDRLGINHIISN